MELQGEAHESRTQVIGSTETWLTETDKVLQSNGNHRQLNRQDACSATIGDVVLLPIREELVRTTFEDKPKATNF